MDGLFGVIGVVVGGLVTALFNFLRDRRAHETARDNRLAELRRDVYTRFLIAAHAACDEARGGPADLLTVMLSRSADADHMEAARFVVLRHELRLVASPPVLRAADALADHLEGEMAEVFLMNNTQDVVAQQAAVMRSVQLLKQLGQSMAEDVRGPSRLVTE